MASSMNPSIDQVLTNSPGRFGRSLTCVSRSEIWIRVTPRSRASVAQSPRLGARGPARGAGRPARALAQRALERERRGLDKVRHEPRVGAVIDHGGRRVAAEL